MTLTPFAIAAGLKISVGEWSPPPKASAGVRYRAAAPPTLDPGWQRKACPYFKEPCKQSLMMDWTWFHKLGSPKWFYEISGRWLPWFAVAQRC